MRNSMMMLTFFSFGPEIPFCANFVQKNRNCYFDLKFRTRLIEYAELCRKYVVFTFSVLDQKNPF